MGPGERTRPGGSAAPATEESPPPSRARGLSDPRRWLRTASFFADRSERRVDGIGRSGVYRLARFPPDCFYVQEQLVSGLGAGGLEDAARRDLYEMLRSNTMPPSGRQRRVAELIDVDEENPMGALQRLEEHAQKASVQTHATETVARAPRKEDLGSSTSPQINEIQFASTYEFAHSACMRLILLSQGLGVERLRNEDMRDESQNAVHMLAHTAVGGNVICCSANCSMGDEEPSVTGVVEKVHMDSVI